MSVKLSTATVTFDSKVTETITEQAKGNRTAANYSVYYVDDAGKLEKLNASYDAATHP